MKCAEWDGTEPQTYCKASKEANSQRKTIGLGSKIYENGLTTTAIYGWGPCYFWREGRMGQSLETE